MVFTLKVDKIIDSIETNQRLIDTGNRLIDFDLYLSTI